MSTFWKVLIMIIITAGIVGGGGWWYMNKKATDEKTKFQSQIDDPNKQITDLKAASTTFGSVSTATTDETASWKIYTNDFLGFSIKYPSNYTEDASTTYQSGHEDRVFIRTSANSDKIISER